MSSTEGDERLYFQSRLLSLPEVIITLSSLAHTLTAAESKKRARLELSLQYSSEQLGFLHSSLIRIDGKHFLLAGPSHIGKTTYGNFLVEEMGGEILAQDWVGVERDGDDFFLSDINFPDKLRQKERDRLDGIIFLTAEDEYRRDSFVPNQEEYLALLASTFDTASPEELEVLSGFWQANKNDLPLYCVVPTRQNTQEYVGNTIKTIIEREKMTWDKVGVIGIGALGQALSFRLGELPETRKVHLYNRSPEKAIGYAMDMNQAIVDRVEHVFEPHVDPAEIFRNSEVVFLCFRDEQGPTIQTEHERWAKIPQHAQIIHEYATLASQENFRGTIFVITNPVDLLTYIMYYTSQDEENPLRTFQIYGVGLEVDLARARYFLEERGYHFDPDEIEILGNHSNEIILKTPLGAAENAQLTEDVKGASKQVRTYVPRTVYAPAAAALKSYLAFKENKSTSLAVLEQEAFIGLPVTFRKGLPGVAREKLLPEYQKILDNNKLGLNGI
jgi:malate/lactate dehydrogenase